MAEKLTPKQQKFVNEYLIDLNATQAAIRAGYSKHTAPEQSSRLLSNVKVKRAVAAATEKLVAHTEITQEWVLNNLKTVTERCMQAAPVLDRKGKPVLIETPDGEVVPAFVFNSAGAIRSVELLGKHIGMFTDKLDITADIDMTSKVNIYLPDNGRTNPRSKP